MTLRKLMEMQKAGALKVDENSNNTSAVIGGVRVEYNQCKMIANAIGWIGRTADKPFTMVDKTDRFIRNMRLYIKNDFIISQTDVAFESIRVTDSEKIYDRIKFVSPQYDLTIFHGQPGSGGSYAVYDADVSRTHPVFTCRTLKALGEYLNDIV